MMTRLLILAAIAFCTAAPSAAWSQRLHGNAVIVFDGSGSMGGVTLDSSRRFSKIGVARTVVEALTSRLSAEPGIELGLVVFGARYDWHTAPRDQACADIVVTEPRGPVTPSSVERIRNAIRAITPQGRTPLGRAIDSAAQALGPTGGSIVVVTDMEETCEAPTDFYYACDVIKRANATRGPADRIYIDSIIVLRAPAMEMEAVSAFHDCTRAPVLEVTNEGQARAIASEVSSRLVNLARQGDHDRSQQVTGRVVFLNAAGAEMTPGDVEIVFVAANGRKITKSGTQSVNAFTLERGTYTLRVTRPRQPAIEQRDLNVSGSSFEIFLTLDK
jgi:hypothetical protein